MARGIVRTIPELTFRPCDGGPQVSVGGQSGNKPASIASPLPEGGGGRTYEDVPASTPGKTWRVGTLTYTGAGLVTLTAWLLWGDFAWWMRERSATSVRIHRTCSLHHDRVARRDPRPPHSVERDGRRLDLRGLFVGQARMGVHDPGRLHRDARGEAPVGRSERVASPRDRRHPTAVVGPAALGLESGTLPGGRYLRARIRGEPPEVYEQIGPTFAALVKAARPDETRPSIEVYSHRDEIDLLLPVADSPAPTG